LGLLTSTNSIDPIDHKLSQRLKSIVLANSTRSPRINLTNWAKEFRLLRGEVTDLKVIEEALEWLGSHFKDPYSPMILSASSFRQKFEKILSAMIRAEGKAPSTKTYSDQVQAEALEVYNTVSKLDWPAKAKDSLLPLIQEGLETFQIVKTRLGAIAREDGGRRQGLAMDAARRLLTKSALIQYFRGVQTRIAKWKGWAGSMEMFRLTLGGPNLKEIIWPPFEKYSCTKIATTLLEAVE
jgi:hypothetical protein